MSEEKGMNKMQTPLRVVCSWCDEVMREGSDPKQDQISHGCCCACKAKYFPTLGDASECRMELLKREHEDCADGSAPRSITCHIDTLECSICERQERTEPYPCERDNCGT